MKTRTIRRIQIGLYVVAGIMFLIQVAGIVVTVRMGR